MTSGQEDRPECGQALRLLDNFLDGELTPEVAAKIGRHLVACDDCARRHKLDAALISGLRIRMGQTWVPSEAIEHVRAALV